MRVFAILCLCVTLSMALIPMMAFEKDPTPAQDEGTTLAPEETTGSRGGISGMYADEEIAVYSSADDRVRSIKMRDYIIGAVAAEMPASYHIEALKAQALCCLTYAVRKTLDEQSNPTAALKGAVISTDSRVHQAYMSMDEMLDRWGENFNENYNKISGAVDAVMDQLIVYDGEPILAVFHAISSGKTESAKNIWGGSGYSYLVPVESEGDELSPQFLATSVLTEKQFSNIAKNIDGVKLGSSAEDWVGESELSENGTVLSIEIGGVKFTGTEVRDYFNLRSPVFSLTYDSDGSFTFRVTGYGHGVGMSQYGADYMARQGAGYEEIIEHYYTGAKIVANA